MKEEDKKLIRRYCRELQNSEKAPSTVQKYVRDADKFLQWLSGRLLNRQIALAYKQRLLKTLSPSRVNAALSSLNSFFAFMGRAELKVKSLKVQRRLFIPEERELTKGEYRKLLQTAERTGQRRLRLIMQTVCSTGMRVSELAFVTVAAVRKGRAQIKSKGKERIVFFPGSLCALLELYAAEKGIRQGPVFISRTGKPLDRSNIWKEMKRLCRLADIPAQKVFPHNLRHLFAKTYYSAMKDIVRLADILGHSNINTTRIYTVESGRRHRSQIENLDLI